MRLRLKLDLEVNVFRVESGFRWVTDEAVGFRTGATLGGGMEAFGFLLGWLVSSTSGRGLLVGCVVPGPTNLEGRAIPLLGVGIPLMISFLKVNFFSLNIFFNEENSRPSLVSRLWISAAKFKNKRYDWLLALTMDFNWLFLFI